MSVPKDPKNSPFATLKFIFIAVVFMVLADHYIFGGKRSYIEEARTVTKEAPAQVPPTRVEPPNGDDFFESIPENPPEEQVGFKNLKIEQPADVPPVIPPVRTNTARIAIVIDDVGMDVRRSRMAIDLPAPITMAMLPYAPKVRELAVQAKQKGHTLIIHTPMEATDSSVNIGPGGLTSGMDVKDLQNAFSDMRASFDGYEGINNHMGSRLTQDKAVMEVLMREVKTHNLFFLDSKTSPKSVAASVAASSGIPHASRDIFLDHVDSAEFVMSALRKTESLALSRGYAIAIGHPKDHTIAGLKAWIPTLKDKGIELVSVKELLSTNRPAKNSELSIHGQKTVQEPQNNDVEMFPEELYQKEMAPTYAPDLFNHDINAVFGNESSGPTIVLDPLPTQSP